MKTATELIITVLRCLADDWECPATICPEVQTEVDGVSRQDVLHTLYKLYCASMIELMEGGSLSHEALMSEPEGDFNTPHWFGLTETGAIALEIKSKAEGVWSKAWVLRPDFEMREGYIEGSTKSACIAALKELSESPVWKLRVDWESLAHSDLHEFKATYYKTIPGGHRINFKMTGQYAQDGLEGHIARQSKNSHMKAEGSPATIRPRLF